MLPNDLGLGSALPARFTADKQALRVTVSLVRHEQSAPREMASAVINGPQTPRIMVIIVTHGHLELRVMAGIGTHGQQALRVTPSMQRPFHGVRNRQRQNGSLSGT